MTDKTCTKCRNTYPLKYFATSPATKDGHAYWCRRCTTTPRGYQRWLANELGFKLCSDCKWIKPLDQFHKQTGRYGGGVRGICKLCGVERASKWQKDNPERAALHTRTYDRKKGIQ